MGTVPLMAATHISTTVKKKTKSRNGCITCKQKRLKCDELKPSCMNCLKRNIECGGYSTRFKWIEPSSVRKPSTSAASILRKSSDVNQVPESKKPALLLNQHLEMTSLSVLGKSLNEVKKENELLAKGLNPNPHLERESRAPQAARMRKSFSMAESPRNNELFFLQRSYSANSSISQSEVEKLRQDLRSENGLHSLAEAAIDDTARSSLEIPTSSPQVSLDAKLKTEASSVPSPTPTNISFPSNTPKEWLFNGTFGSESQLALLKPTTNENEWTPSMSALINYVFTSGDGAEFDNVLETPFSPLDLSTSSASDTLVHREYDPQKHHNSPNISNNSLGENKNLLFYNIDNLLRRNEAQSPSISSTALSNGLMSSGEHEQILFLFSSYTCGIMSIKAGPLENPWQELSVPLAREYSCVFNSIASMTLFHLAGNRKLSKESDTLRSKGYFYMKKCILELANGLKRIDDKTCETSMPADIALCTCLNLAVCEAWDTHTSSGIAHLKGAKSMIQKVFMLMKQYSESINTHKEPSQSPKMKNLKSKLILVKDNEWERLRGLHTISDPCSPEGPSTDIIIPRNLQLLFNQWIYLHVLSQMTALSNHDDRGIDLVATITSMIQSTQKKIRPGKHRGSDLNLPTSSDKSELNNLNGSSEDFTFFGEFDSIFNNTDYIDPLLGCSQSLFLMMSKVASLIFKIRREREKLGKLRNSLEHMSQASELKQQLTDWKPNISHQVSESHNSNRSAKSTWDLYSCVSTAEAYRYATLLYLHQAVPELPSLTSHQLAEKVFILMAAVPSASNLYIIHVYPLLISSCEAENGDERDWCIKRWSMLAERLWIGNVDRAFEVMKEVWRRKDEYYRRRKRELENCALNNGMEAEDPNGIASQIGGLMAAINNDGEENMGICSPFHWSTVMKEWGWEVFLG